MEVDGRISKLHKELKEKEEHFARENQGLLMSLGKATSAKEAAEKENKDLQAVCEELMSLAEQEEETGGEKSE